LLQTYKLPSSLDLFNVLLKRCFVLDCAEQARSLLRLLPSFNLTPNIVTWGVCALGVRTKADAETLLLEMEAAKFT